MWWGIIKKDKKGIEVIIQLWCIRLDKCLHRFHSNCIHLVLGWLISHLQGLTLPLDKHHSSLRNYHTHLCLLYICHFLIYIKIKKWVCLAYSVSAAFFRVMWNVWVMMVWIWFSTGQWSSSTGGAAASSHSFVVV